tara:strand:- start:834 stop:1517 length:684 start_codon:yes stop_codon:yes gene_type:complete
LQALLQISKVIATDKIMSDKPNTNDFITPPSAITSSEKTVGSSASTNELSNAAKKGNVLMRPKDMNIAVLTKMNEKFGSDKVVEILAECMAATKTIAIAGRPMEVPDHKVRLDTAKTVMQYQVGNPVTRQEVVTHNVDTLSSLQSKLQKSPALRRAVGNMLGDSTEVVDVSPQRELSSDEELEAAAELQRIPQAEDTEVGKAIRKVVPVDSLKSKGQFDNASEKYSN